MEKLIEQLFDAIEQNNSHISPQMKQMKYDKMSASPFTFFRATNHLFWQKYTNDERLKQFSNNNQTWIQGDMHVYNFGMFHNHDGDIVYDLNDFDETIIADYQYDLWRFATSVLLACRSETEFSEKKEKDIIEKFAKEYRKAARKIIKGEKKEKEFVTKKNSSTELKEELKRCAKKESRKKMLNKWTNNVEGKRRFDMSKDKLKRISVDKRNEIENELENYISTLQFIGDVSQNHFNIKDIAERQFSGLGSFGVPRYYILIEGDDSKVDDDILLDVKWQSKPTAYKFMHESFKENYNKMFENEGQRYVKSYIDMIKYNDPYLGWLHLSDGYYAVREISPYKSYVPVEELTKKKEYKKMMKYWAQIISSSHLFSTDSFDRNQFLKLTKGKKKEFTDLIYEVASEFAIEIEKEWQLFRATLEVKSIK